MQTFQIEIKPLSPGTTEEDRGLTPGDGSYLTTPSGPRSMVLPMTDVQLAGLQGYLVAMKAGTVTTTVETAVTAVLPT